MHMWAVGLALESELATLTDPAIGHPTWRQTLYRLRREGDDYTQCSAKEAERGHGAIIFELPQKGKKQ